MRFALAILAALAIGTIAAAGFVYSGVYDVSATRPHTAVVNRVLETLRSRSVSARVDEVPPAPELDAEVLEHGFVHYDAMCVVCHGAPGMERGEFGKGMTPSPPLLAKESHPLSERHLFWIIKNGIKIAGMPAFGPTHSDEEIWGLVGVVRRLPEMTPEDYQIRVASSTGTASPGADSLETSIEHDEPGHAH